MSKYTCVTKADTPQKMDDNRKNVVNPILTDVLYKTYCFIERYNKRFGKSPSYRQIGDAFGISKQAIEHRLWSLIRLGAVKKPYYRPNNIELIGTKKDWKPYDKKKVFEIRSKSSYEGEMTKRLNKIKV